MVWDPRRKSTARDTANQVEEAESRMGVFLTLKQIAINVHAVNPMYTRPISPVGCTIL